MIFVDVVLFTVLDSIFYVIILKLSLFSYSNRKKITNEIFWSVRLHITTKLFINQLIA